MGNIKTHENAKNETKIDINKLQNHNVFVKQAMKDKLLHEANNPKGKIQLNNTELLINRTISNDVEDNFKLKLIKKSNRNKTYTKYNKKDNLYKNNF